MAQNMTQNDFVIGIDVGGVKKGFHAVAHRNGVFYDKLQSQCPKELAAWSLSHSPAVVAIDSPSAFSIANRSRKAERDLVKADLHCFYTPTKALAKQSHFYDWVFNGELIYRHLNLPVYLGEHSPMPCCIETFPHAVHNTLWRREGAKAPVGSKTVSRRQTLTSKANYDVSSLTSLDFVDAALCALAADYFRLGHFQAYGCKNEGFIVLPSNSNSI